MTTFQRDLQEILDGNSVEVMQRRKAEIKNLKTEGKACKNSFRLQFIIAELKRLTNEYNILDSYI